MPSPNPVKKAKESLEKGDLKTALALVKSSKCLTNNDCMDLVISLYKNCQNPTNVRTHDLQEFVTTLLSLFKTDIEPKQFLNYLRSVFYIVKCLLDLKPKDFTIVKLLLLPPFAPGSYDSQQVECYNNICRMIYLFMTQNKDNNSDLQAIYKLCIIVIETTKRTMDSLQKIEWAYRCSDVIAKGDKLSVDCLVSFIDLGLDSFSGGGDDNEELIYKRMISCYTNWNSLLAVRDCAKCDWLYDKVTLRATACFKKLHNIFLKVIKLCHWLNPTGTFARSPGLAMFKKLLSSNSPLVEVSFSSVTVTIKTTSLILSKDHWNDKDFESQLTFLTFLNEMANLLRVVKIAKCTCRKKCDTTTNVYDSLRCYSSMVQLIEISPSTVKFAHLVQRLFEDCSKIIVRMTADRCDSWIPTWEYVCASLLRICAKLDYDEFTCQTFARFYAQLKPNVVTRVTDKNLCAVLSKLASTLAAKFEYDKAMALMALSMVLKRDGDCNRYVVYKAEARKIDDRLLQVTAVSSYESSRAFLNDYVMTTELTDDVKADLLIAELRCYRERYRSRLAMMSTFRELIEVASPRTLASVFVEIWGECSLNVHDDLTRLLDRTFYRLQQELARDKGGHAYATEDDLNLAYLYFLKHKYGVNDAIHKTACEIEQTINLIGDDNDNDEKDSDPNAECDVVPVYGSLTLANYLRMMGDLNESYKIAIDKVKLSDSVSLTKFFNLLTLIGHEYFLHNFLRQPLVLFRKAIDLARLLKNNNHLLASIAMVLELSKPTSDLSKTLLADGNDIVAKRHGNGDVTEDCVVSYYLAVASAFIHTDFEVAYGAFKMARLLVERNEVSLGNLFIVRAKLRLLSHRFNLLPCRFDVADHDRLVMIHLAQQDALTYYGTAQGGINVAQHMRTVFEIGEAISSWYHALDLPRELRCYTKQMLDLAQKMVLPFRTVTLLTYLTHADIITCRFDDGRSKIDGIYTILGLAENPTHYDRKNPVRTVIDDLTLDLNEITLLDLPRRNFTREVVEGSPTSFPRDAFKLSRYLAHDNCGDQCFYCNSIEYPEFVVKLLYLQGVLYCYEGEMWDARDFFLGALRVHDEMKTVFDRVDCEVIRRPRGFLEGYCWVLLECVNLGFVARHLAAARHYAEMLRGLLLPLGDVYPILLDKVLLRELMICQQEEDEKFQSDDNNVELVVTGNTDNDSVTPEKTVLSTNHPDPSLYLDSEVKSKKVVKKHLKKVLVFDESDDGNTFKAPVPPPTVTVRPTGKSRIPRIYVDGAKDDGKTPRRTGLKRSDSTKSLDLNTALLDFSLDTGSSKDSEDESFKELLGSRTKLLTEKLKSATKSKTEANKRSDASSKSRVRKNLAAVVGADGDGLRRSRRNLDK